MMLFPSNDFPPQIAPLVPRAGSEDDADGYARGRCGAWSVSIGGIRYTETLGGGRHARSMAWWRGYDRGRREWVALTMPWMARHISGLDLFARA